MGRRKKVIMALAEEDNVRRVARIMGEMSAAQAAINKAAEYTAKGWAVKYWYTNDNHIVVEGIDPETMKRDDAASSPSKEEK